MVVTSSFHVLLLVYLFLDCVCGEQDSDPKVVEVFQCNITSKRNGSSSGGTNQESTGDWCGGTSVETEKFNLTSEACLLGFRSANLTSVNECFVLHKEVRNSWSFTNCTGYRVKNSNYSSCKHQNCSSNNASNGMIFTYLKCHTSQNRKSFCLTCVPSARKNSSQLKSNECAEGALRCKFVLTTTTTQPIISKSKSKWTSVLTKFLTECSHRNSFIIGAGVMCLVLLSAVYVCHRRRAKRKQSRDLQLILTTPPRPDDNLTMRDNSENNPCAFPEVGNFSQTQEASENEAEHSPVEETTFRNRDSFLDSETMDDNYTYPDAGNVSDKDDAAEYSYAYAHTLGYRMKKNEPFYENVEATMNSDYQERRPSDFEVHEKEPKQRSYRAFRSTDEEVDAGKDGSLPRSNSASSEIYSEPEVVYVDVCN